MIDFVSKTLNIYTTNKIKNKINQEMCAQKARTKKYFLCFRFTYTWIIKEHPNTCLNS